MKIYIFYRSSNCPLLLPSLSRSCCSSCHSSVLKFQNESKQNIATQNKPAHLNAPVKFTSPERIKLTLQGHRLKCKQLEKEVSKYVFANNIKRKRYIKIHR